MNGFSVSRKPLKRKLSSATAKVTSRRARIILADTTGRYDGLLREIAIMTLAREQQAADQKCAVLADEGGDHGQ